MERGILMNANLKKTVMAALFAALACVATMSIRIPTPGTGGYIHPGDAIVILSGVVLGPVWGLLAGGIGSALADLLGGYFIYVPITFVIKGLIGFISGLLYQKLSSSKKSRYAAVFLGGIADIILVAGGYFLCESVMYGAGAATSIPANIIQGTGGLVLSLILYPVLIKIPDIHQMAIQPRTI
jgi:ECF transporter S component (folate family)